MDAEQQIRVRSTLPRLHLEEEARHQALRREEAQQVPAPVPDPRGHRRGHRLQVKSVRVVTSRPEVSRPDEIFEMKMILIYVILFIL